MRNIFPIVMKMTHIAAATLRHAWLSPILMEHSFRKRVPKGLFLCRKCSQNEPLKVLVDTILCLIPRTTVTSLSAPKDTHAARCILYHVYASIPVFLFERVRKHTSCARYDKRLPPEYAHDVTVVLEVRQSIEHLDSFSTIDRVFEVLEPFFESLTSKVHLQDTLEPKGSSVVSVNNSEICSSINFI